MAVESSDSQAHRNRVDSYAGRCTLSWRRAPVLSTATAATASTWAKETLGPNAIFAGLAYPILVCLVTLLVGGLFIRETKDHRLEAEPRAS